MQSMVARTAAMAYNKRVPDQGLLRPRRLGRMRYAAKASRRILCENRGIRRGFPFQRPYEIKKR
jgi:hypothetical protein